MTDELFYRNAFELADLIKTREVSPVEVMRAHFERIESVNPRINAIVTLSQDAMAAAQEAESALKRGAPVGPLHGVPFTVKDSIDTDGVLTQRGSPIFRGRVPEQDATAVTRMKNAGAILLAKTNLPEFSYWVESDNLLTGRTNNPWNLERTSGGSSGGESAAIAAGMSPLGLGTDLAISLRGPAANTGIVALKATHGRVPMTSIWPRVPRRFWHVGPMARSVADVALAYSILSGPDGKDAFSSNTAQFDAGIDLSSGRQLRVGWLVGPGFGPVDPQIASVVEAAAKALQSAGCSVEEVRIPALERDFPLDVFNRIHVMEMKPAFQEATAGHSPDEIYKMAHTMLSLPDTPMADFVRAEQAAERLRDGYAEYFQRYDILLTHVVPVVAQKHGVTELHIEGKTLDVAYIQGATVPQNITGLPALSMRFGTSSDGLPIGIQIIAGWQAESTVLHAAALLEQHSSVRELRPPL